jgi:hypothetical protein
MRSESQYRQDKKPAEHPCIEKECFCSSGKCHKLTQLKLNKAEADVMIDLSMGRRPHVPCTHANNSNKKLIRVNPL